jgi:EAL domain-containing protein (putative c-di-GMP-specific phosphodiesterase class I)
VVEELCRHASGWALEGSGFQLHFNASVVELQHPHYAHDVLRRIARHKLEASRFVLEVTESDAVLDAARVSAVLDELRAAGMRVAIGDFGSGHASLTRLKDLPADMLKIGRGIIADVAVSREAKAIVATTVSLAGELGMDVVAEGIETNEQRAMLVSAGCAYGQGYIIGRPSEIVPGR